MSKSEKCTRSRGKTVVCFWFEQIAGELCICLTYIRKHFESLLRRCVSTGYIHRDTGHWLFFFFFFSIRTEIRNSTFRVVVWLTCFNRKKNKTKKKKNAHDPCPFGYNHEKVTSRSINPAGTWRKYNVASMSMQRHDVASTLRRRYIYVMCPLGTVVLLNPDMPCLCKQCRSEDANWSGSALFVITHEFVPTIWIK